MAKFVIECPSCGRYAEASTGFFAKKKIDCGCGYTINVKTDTKLLFLIFIPMNNIDFFAIFSVNSMFITDIIALPRNLSE